MRRCRRSGVTGVARCRSSVLGRVSGPAMVRRARTLEADLGVHGTQAAGEEEMAETRPGGHGAIRLRAPPRRCRSRGGNAKKLTRLRAGRRMEGNAFAFLGGLRLWERKSSALMKTLTKRPACGNCSRRTTRRSKSCISAKCLPTTRRGDRQARLDRFAGNFSFELRKRSWTFRVVKRRASTPG